MAKTPSAYYCYPPLMRLHGVFESSEKATGTRPPKRARNGAVKRSKETENTEGIPDEMEDDDDDGEVAEDAELSIMIKEHVGSMLSFNIMVQSKAELYIRATSSESIRTLIRISATERCDIYSCTQEHQRVITRRNRLHVRIPCFRLIP
jgi:hypothetical protein